MLIELAPFYKVIARTGSRAGYISAMAVFAPSIGLLLHIGAGISGTAGVADMAALTASLGGIGLAKSCAYYTLIMIISERGSSRGQKLGATHGISSTAASLGRVLGPGLAGWIWESCPVWVVFAVMVLTAMASCIIACLFLKEYTEDGEMAAPRTEYGLVVQEE